MPTFPAGFDQRSLWVDPLEPHPIEDFGAVLRAEHIRRYIDDHNLLVDREDFRPNNLKGASYTMSPHPTEAWIITDDGEHQLLARKQNSRGSYYIVPRNALVYIRLYETLRMPFYFIGRHNLKIDYVYQGLLLGTGPQVDPGYIGKIYIPLHNLTNQPVEVYLEESFVSIDFVRTEPLRLDNGVPNTYEEFYELYGETKRPIRLEKVDEKVNLHAYLQGSRPSSSLGHLVPRVEKMAADLRRRRLIEVALFLSVLVFLATLLTTYFLHFDRQLTSKTDDQTKKIESLQTDLVGLRNGLSSVPSQPSLSEIDKKVQQLRQDFAIQLESLRKEVEASNLTRPTPGGNRTKKP
jgi:deoxycytidine triphosphate deaminase